MEHLPRVIDSELDALFPDLSAIALEGAKGVGKTETAMRRVRDETARGNCQLRLKPNKAGSAG